MMRSALLTSLALCLALLRPAIGAEWAGILEAARGQTVYFHAWGGEQRVNDFIAWAGTRTEDRFGVAIRHVKLTDTAEAVSRVLAEKAAGRNTGGSVDLIWINGENFASMKSHDLLLAAWAPKLPNWQLTNPDANPAVRLDFTVPTDGMESPWAKAQLVFYHDSAIVPAPPKTPRQLLDWAGDNPGQFAYPLPPNFLGTSFLKQTLIGLSGSDPALLEPVTDKAYDRLAPMLFTYLDQLHPHLWRKGRSFPSSSGELRRLMGDGEIGLALSFNPAEAPSAIANGELPASVRTYAFDGGTLGNVNFVAIPYNAANKEGAMAVANFLLSVEAQARMQDPAILGNLSVLDLAMLSVPERALFERIEVGLGGIAAAELGPVLLEPHPSWVARLETGWADRYGAL